MTKIEMVGTFILQIAYYEQRVPVKAIQPDMKPTLHCLRFIFFSILIERQPFYSHFSGSRPSCPPLGSALFAKIIHFVDTGTRF